MHETPTPLDREAAKRRLGQEVARRRLRSARRVAVRGIAVVCGEVLLLAILVWGLLTFVLGIAIVNGDSMYPTLHSGDLVVYFRLGHACQPGDIIVYEDNGPVVKRIIAGPGDMVEIDNDSGAVSVNGRQLHETYTASGSYLHGDVVFPLTVPPGAYFVLGDNRGNSIDSRNLAVGTISEQDILGTVLRLYRKNI